MSDLMSELRENGQVKPVRSNKIVESCGVLSEMWEEGYFSSSAEEARLTALEIVEICKSLSSEVSSYLTEHDFTQVRVVETPEAKTYKSGEWRSGIWIDCMYDLTKDGQKNDYDWIARSDKGAHLFRIWFTAKGVGIGLRMAGRKTHMTRQLLIDELPIQYHDLAPVASGRYTSHDLHLMGRRGQMNHYFAKWFSEPFSSDEDFFKNVVEEWHHLGGYLNKYRC